MNLKTLIFSALIISSNCDAAVKIAEYKFDETSGFTAADSIRGNSGIGELIGYTDNPNQWVNGKVGGALSFNGSTNYVRAPLVGSALTTFSISGWVWLNAPSQWATIVKNWGASAVGAFHFGLTDNDGKLSNYLGFSDNSASAVIDPNLLQTNAWVHVAITYDGAVQNLYVNQVKVASSDVIPPNNPLSSNFPLYMSMGAKLNDAGDGIANPNPGQLDGLLDELTFWDGALTESDIDNLFNAISSPTDISATAGINSAKVTFSPVTGATSYTAKCTPNSGGTTGTFTGSSSPLQVSGLTADKDYTCTVTASDGTYTSDPSTPSNVVVPLAPTPSNPIPTLSEWAQMAMMLLMLVTGGWYARRMKQQ